MIIYTNTIKAMSDFMKTSDYFTSIEEFSQTTSVKNLIIDAFKEIAPIKKNYLAFIIPLVLAIVLSIKLSFCYNTLTHLQPIIEIILTVTLVIFGCVFAVYSILLASLSDDYIKKLAMIDYDDSTSYLKKSTMYFESILYLYFIGIGITWILLIFLKTVDTEVVIFSNIYMNNIISCILSLFYFWFIFRIFYEIKSTIYNTIILFRASIAYKLLAVSKNEDKGEGNNK